MRSRPIASAAAAVALLLLQIGIRCEAGVETPLSAALARGAGSGLELARRLERSLMDGGHSASSLSTTRLASRLSRKMLTNETLNQGLLTAAEDGDIYVVDTLLGQGADVDAVDLNGNTPLILAAGNGHVDVMRVLLNHGADIDFQGYFGATALWTAVDLEELDAATFLLEQNADMEITTDDGATALYLAASNSYLPGVKVMLEHGAKVETRYLRTGHTPLLRSAWLGDVDIVRALLEYNADTEARTTFGFTALHVASLAGNLEVVTALLSHSADIQAVSFGNGENVVHLAAWRGHLQVLRVLLGKGANVTAVDVADRSALHYAAYFPDNVAVLTLLVDDGLDVNKKNAYGSTPVHLAAWSGNAANVAFFVSKGADKDPGDIIVCGCLNVEIDSDYEGCPEGNCESDEDKQEIMHLLGAASTPQTLIEAVNANDMEAVRRLLAGGEDVNASDANGDTPLIFASAAGFEPIVVVLLDAGADVAARDSRGFNALHFAAMFGRTDTVNILIGRGAVVDDPGVLGFTALHLSAEEGKLRATRALLAAGADPNARTLKTGSTPIALAVVGNHIDVVQQLIGAGGDATIASVGGVTTLFDASATVGSELIMDLLIEEGVEVNARSDSGSTAVEFAAYYGNKGGVEHLLSKGADPALAAGDGVLDEVCGCLEDAGDTSLRQCPRGTCQTQSDIDEIDQLMKGAEPEASLSGSDRPSPAQRSPEPGMGTDVEDCSQISDRLARLDCVSWSAPTT